MYKSLLALILAAVPNCPLVDVAGSYTLDLRTDSGTILSDNHLKGCTSTGYVYKLRIQPDGLMVASRLYWLNKGGESGVGIFGGRVEPGSEPMQWVGSAGDVEFKGTWRRGELSGEFTRRFVYDGK